MNLLYPTIYKEKWLKALEKVFSTRWIGQGPLVDEFENKFGKKFKYEYCLAVNSGTSALELAYHLIGIEEGDEVLTAVLTCTATNIPLVRRKADIKFLDINNSLVVDYEDVKKKISSRTKALIVVNLGGIQVDERIYDLAKKYNVPVVVDACQSLGINEKHGNYICYSFQAIKHFTTGDGGMLVVRNKEDYKIAKKLRWFGIDREAKKRADWKWLVNHKMAMDIEEVGYKYHMNDIAASLGFVGLEHSDEILKYRKDLCDAYAKNLPNYVKIYGGSYWLFAILTDKRNELMEYLRENDIECDLIQVRNDIFKVFGGKKQKLLNMDRLESKYLYLPLHYEITFEDVDRVTKILRTWKT